MALSIVSSADRVLMRKEGAIRWLVFNQPEKRNALSLDMTVRGLELIEEFSNDDGARVLIVTGAGERAFVSGGDISEFEEKAGSAAAQVKFEAISRRMYAAIQETDKPVVAMIRGYCFGVGVALAACCDFRICSDDATFCIPAAKLGVAYSPEFMRLVLNVIGPAFTNEIFFTAGRFSASEAAGMGLVNRVVEKAELENYVRSCAGTIAENAPLSHRATKVVVRECMKDPEKRDLESCARAIGACADSEDFRNARQAFLEKRKPVFVGR